MRRKTGGALAAAMMLAGSVAAQPVVDGADVTVRGVFGDDQNARALAAVEKALRGERVNALDIGQLDNALIRLETAAAKDGVDAGRGKEGSREGGPVASKSLYLLNFATGSGDASDLQVLAIQREMLKNQLMVLKSLGVIANQQAGAGSRTARVESGARDMTLSMKSSAGEMRKVAGDAAATLAKVNDVNRITADMAVDLKEMAKDIESIEGAITNVESLIRKTAARQESRQDDMQRQTKKMERKVMNKLEEVQSAVEQSNK